MNGSRIILLSVLKFVGAYFVFQSVICVLSWSINTHISYFIHSAVMHLQDVDCNSSDFPCIELESMWNDILGADTIHVFDVTRSGGGDIK